MASPSTRQGMIDYCLRALGAPVIEINVDDDQVEDRIDEAFQFYRDYHYDAVEMVYLKEQITASTLTLNTNNAASFTVGEKITGSTSGAVTFVHQNKDVNEIYTKNTNGTFVANETVTGSISGTTATVTSMELGNFDNRYVTLNDSVLSVVRTLPLSSRSNGISFFDAKYQLMLNNIQSLTNTDIQYYTMLKMHINLINDLMTGQKPVRFNRHMNRLYIDLTWGDGGDLAIGDYVIIEAYRTLDPNTYTDVYNDYFLLAYATALIKRQWGINLKKFEGVQLPGGVTMNGQKIFDEAMEEIAKLKEDAKSEWQLPVDFFVG
ncbi:neck protein [uncultured Caudovirales phage]|uniref:Neck protein n=1 Tax=uncultured Caudovirales phage TaxID=2100421 RepID=A0A6J7WYF0_9CAUD|nr:neck protein [uncultured Caudovirales phage]